MYLVGIQKDNEVDTGNTPFDITKTPFKRPCSLKIRCFASGVFDVTLNTHHI